MIRPGKTTATLLTAAALVASSPEASAAELQPASHEISKAAKRNPASRLARGILKQIGGRVLNLKPRGDNVAVDSSINSLGISARSVTINTGNSLEPGSNGEYTIEASAFDVGRNNRLDRSDIDRIQISSGSYVDGGPLFSLRLYHAGSNLDESLFANSYHVRGTVIDGAGSRVRLIGSTHPLFVGPGERLDKPEVASTGSAMEGIINEALNDQPTHRIESPFDPIQR